MENLLYSCPSCLWHWPWKQQIILFAWHSKLGRCTITPNLVTKGWEVQKIIIVWTKFRLTDHQTWWESSDNNPWRVCHVSHRNHVTADATNIWVLPEVLQWYAVSVINAGCEAVLRKAIHTVQFITAGSSDWASFLPHAVNFVNGLKDSGERFCGT